jgi:transposase InsO family protein
MDKVTKVEVCWKLYQGGISPEEIPKHLEVSRATVYRWLAGIRLKGIRMYLKEYREAKRVRHRKKTDGGVKAAIYRIREEYRGCCGQKIRFLLKGEGIFVSLSTIYRVLGERYRLRRGWKKNVKRGPVEQGKKAREVMQMDTVDLGELYAYTAIDTCTREADVVILTALTAAEGARALEAHLKDFGPLGKVQKDGGSEFKREWMKKARASVGSIRTSRPYRKNEQAFIERFNGILRKECVGYRQYRKHEKQTLQKLVDEYLAYYHYQRPHLSLNMLTPSAYAMSHLQ